MRICLFLSFRLRPGSSISAAESAKLDGFLGATPRLSKALVHTPARANDPYLDDGAPPQLVLQLYFTELPEMEDVLARGGQITPLARDTLKERRISVVFETGVSPDEAALVRR